jgi:hypothetical protein
MRREVVPGLPLHRVCQLLERFEPDESAPDPLPPGEACILKRVSCLPVLRCAAAAGDGVEPCCSGCGRRGQGRGWAGLAAHRAAWPPCGPPAPPAGLLEGLQSESPRSDGASTPSPTAKPEDEYAPPDEAMLLADGGCVGALFVCLCVWWGGVGGGGGGTALDLAACGTPHHRLHSAPPAAPSA